MKIYRVFTLAAADMPIGSIVDAVVIAPDPATARAIVSVEETEREAARRWLLNNTAVIVHELGEASQEYLDGHVNGDDDPHLVTVERKQ